MLSWWYVSWSVQFTQGQMTDHSYLYILEFTNSDTDTDNSV